MGLKITNCSDYTVKDNLVIEKDGTAKIVGEDTGFWDGFKKKLEKELRGAKED